MNKEYNIDSISRLAGLFIERDPTILEKGVLGYEEVLENIKSYRLHLICDGKISTSKALQAALITAVNAGKRAFQGGVSVSLANNIPFLLPWHKNANLHEVVIELGGEINNVEKQFSYTLTFGTKALQNNSLEVVCNGWQAGVCTYDDDILLDSEVDFSLGGVAAGSIGVALAFFKLSEEKVDACSKSIGISLWRPDLHWLDSDSKGPVVSILPKNYWFLGLGHLGQAFTWTLSLLPFPVSSEIIVQLQDFDIASVSNWETGLLSEMEKIGEKKTRICSYWLERLGIKTNIIERRFENPLTLFNDDPKILIIGLDSIEARKVISTEKFSQVLDCGIGGTRKTFDSISVLNFPEYPGSLNEYWSSVEKGFTNRAYEAMIEKIIGCGKFEKGISTSFVGAFSSTLVLGELIRGFMKGIKISNLSISMRNLERSKNITTNQNYSTELISSGYCLIS